MAAAALLSMTAVALSTWHAAPRMGALRSPAARAGVPALRSPAARAGVPALTVATAPSAPPATDMRWCEEPDSTWLYDDLTVNYIAAGPEDAQPFLLIHGFGASGFHWRRNINALAAAGYRVYAIDLIGFGLSSKPVVDYDSRMWREQCAAFLREVAGCGVNGRRAIVAGNSIGGCE